MFKLFKPADKRKLPKIEPLDPISKTALDKPVEFAPIAMDRIVATPVKAAMGHHKDAQKRGFATEELSPKAKALVAKLDAQIGTPYLCVHFPSVINRLASSWENADDFYTLLDSFLVDQRGNREGFPFEALKELSNIGEYYENYVRKRASSSTSNTKFRMGY